MLDATTKQLASEGRNFAALAIHLSNGQILNHVMWVDADDEHMLINTETHRAKYKAMTNNPDVTVTVWNAENPYSYSEVRGKVVGEVRGDEARAHIDTLSQRYTGGPYQGDIQSERVIVRIAPVRQRGQ